MAQPKTSPITIAAWALSGAAALGTFLPWAGSTSAAGYFFEFFTSQASRPNAEWVLLFCAPLAASGLMARSLLKGGKPDVWVLIPCAVFLLAWVLLFLSGYRAYSGLGDPGYTLTLLGVLGLTGVTGWSLHRERTAGAGSG